MGNAKSSAGTPGIAVVWIAGRRRRHLGQELGAMAIPVITPSTGAPLASKTCSGKCLTMAWIGTRRNAKLSAGTPGIAVAWNARGVGKSKVHEPRMILKQAAKSCLYMFFI